MNAVHIFANDPNGDPIRANRDESDDDDPIDNLAAPVGILVALALGLILWAIILVVFLWLR